MYHLSRLPRRPSLRFFYVYAFVVYNHPMGLLGIQILSLLFACFMLYVAFIHFKKTNLTRVEFSLWVAIWSVFIFFALFPRVLDPLLARLFIFRAMDLLMIVAFMILTYLGFQNHIGIKSLQRQHRSLVSNLAKKNAQKSKTK